MSFQKMIQQYRHLLINPRPVMKPMPSPTMVFMRIFMAIRKRFWLISGILILMMIMIALLIPEGTFSIYDDFGITGKTKQPTGLLWDILWWIRGQPAGWQTPHATGIFAVGKIIGDGGFNGPLNPLALLLEFIVDFTIYLPHFLDPGFVLVNLDLIPGFFLKMAIDIGALGLFVLIMIPLFGVLVFFSPLIGQRLFAASGPILKILLLVGFLLFVYMLFMGYLDPFFESLIGS